MNTPSLPPPGWYAHPSGGWRWWDGEHWHDVVPQPPVYAAVPVPAPLKDVGVAYLFAILLPGTGAHQFYLRNTGLGLAQLLMLLGGAMTLFVLIGFFVLAALGIWWFVDLFLIPGYTRSVNARIATGRP